MKYAFIEEHAEQYSVSLLCQYLDVSRSGYYHWLSRPESLRKQTDQVLTQQIKDAHYRYHEAYGTVRIWKLLNAKGICCGRDRVARLRRAANIETKRRKRFKTTTHSKYTLWIAPNHLQRNFSVHQPNLVWVGDVTFIPTREGWLYLAVMIDLYSRKVVGWSMSDRNNLKLVTAALQMAIEERLPAAGLIHHTDRGSLYAAHSYRQLQEEHGIIPSMSRKGDCYDNAVAESFFASLKNELVYFTHYNSRQEAKTDIFRYIEIFYNRQRLHQTLGYQTPVQFDENVA